MVKFLGLYDPWSSFSDFSPSVHRPATGIDLATDPWPQARGEGPILIVGQPLPAEALAGRGASNDLNLTLKNMTLNDLILKEFGFQLKAKMEVFSKVFACVDAT